MESFWGATTYELNGLLKYSDNKLSGMKVSMQRISGFASGVCSLSLVSKGGKTGELVYQDGVNTSLALMATIQSDADDEKITIKAEGCGFKYASFLASGESLGGAEANY